MVMEQVMSSVMEKLKEALLMMLNFGGEIVSWFDEVFPPETRVEKINYWFHLALPYLIIALFLSLFMLCCYCVALLGWGLSKLINKKMMKAPGRNYNIYRDDFELDPSDYFRRLCD
ncbi:hypothetical protein RND71_002863 [Anisodus tanguticus]|uniref:Uncharacterized protein n=1 Tax=Anisodus tanguticus TaxID=243964 RepID=A0AAE1VPG8_9SOLA|nr:hypothetical protein RND71_002863 [Anisodus tanguticus]